jgi:hypothetical protein
LAACTSFPPVSFPRAHFSRRLPPFPQTALGILTIFLSLVFLPLSFCTAAFPFPGLRSHALRVILDSVTNRQSYSRKGVQFFMRKRVLSLALSISAAAAGETSITPKNSGDPELEATFHLSKPTFPPTP